MIVAACGVILSKEPGIKLLMAQRYAPGQDFNHKWYFPMEILKDSDTLETALIRGLIQKFGVYVDILWALKSHRVNDSLLVSFVCGHREGTPAPSTISGNSDAKWLTRRRITTLDLIYPEVMSLIITDFNSYLDTLK